MSMVVVAYPKISRKSRDWIDGVRKAHDELYHGVIEPHFTLVFPLRTVEAKELGQHVRAQTAGIGEIPFALRCAICVRDAFSDYTHVFLVPDGGFSAIVRLHDTFYTGILAPELRLDIPFIPHIGVGNSRDALKAKRLADELNAEALCVEGAIETLDIASYVENRVTTIEQIALKAGS